jgi:hypothetical protein
MWLSDDALLFSFLFIIPNALRSASIPTGQTAPWSENYLSRDWLMRSIAHCAHVIYSPLLSSPEWCARPAIGHSLGIEFRGLTEGHRSEPTGTALKVPQSDDVVSSSKRLVTPPPDFLYWSCRGRIQLEAQIQFPWPKNTQETRI